MPKRIQMTRRKPWRHLSPQAVIVDRRGPYGNPYRVVRRNPIAGPVWDIVITTPTHRVVCGTYLNQFLATCGAVELHRQMVAKDPELIARIRTELAGRDVACWCGENSVCHGDTYLRVAAGGAP